MRPCTCKENRFLSKSLWGFPALWEIALQEAVEDIDLVMVDLLAIQFAFELHGFPPSVAVYA
jgi:hypothetical protein